MNDASHEFTDSAPYVSPLDKTHRATVEEAALSFLLHDVCGDLSSMCDTTLLVMNEADGSRDAVNTLLNWTATLVNHVRGSARSIQVVAEWFETNAIDVSLSELRNLMEKARNARTAAVLMSRNMEDQEKRHKRALKRAISEERRRHA